MSDDSRLFVSHVNKDHDIAFRIVAALERQGVRCWIAPRDVTPGARYEDAIADAIDNCRAFLLVFSDKCNDSEYISRELNIAGGARKLIIPLRIEDAKPRRGLVGSFSQSDRFMSGLIDRCLSHLRSDDPFNFAESGN